MNRNEEKKKIVITGASGFLGRHLTERIRDDKRYFVYALSSRGEELQRQNAYDNVKYCSKDIVFTDSGKLILDEATVVNCAFPRNAAGIGMADGLKYIQKLFDRACDCSVNGIINISSQSVYSVKREIAVTESDPVCLESPYAVGKYASELMLESVCRKFGINYTNIRMASLIGPEFEQRIVNRFVKQALETGKLNVDDNQQKFGFFDIRDAVFALVKVLEADAANWKAVYNLGGSGAYSLVEIAETVKEELYKITGKQIEISIVKGDKEGSSELNSNMFYKDFDFAPEETLSESVRRIAEGYESLQT